MITKLRRILPVLLVLCFLFVPLAFASAPTDAGVIDAVSAEHAVVEGGAVAVHATDSLSHEKLMDLFWRVVNFAALMIILVKFGAKPIGNALSGRQAQVKAEVEDLEARRAKAEQEFRDFTAKLSAMEGEVDTIVERAVAQAEIEKAKILEKAEQAAADIKRAADQAIQNEITNAKRTLREDVADQAAVMAEELIVKNLNADDQVKIVEDYLAKVGAVQ